MDTAAAGEIKEIWDSVDLDKSGSLDQAEMREVLLQMGQSPSPAKFQKMFAQLDPQGTGGIVFEVFSAWCAKQDRRHQKAKKQQGAGGVGVGGGGTTGQAVVTPTAPPRPGDAIVEAKLSAKEQEEKELEEMKRHWGRFDSDASGMLSQAEIKRVLEAMKKETTDVVLAEAMAEIDSDGSGEVSYEEFARWWAKQDPSAQQQLTLLEELLGESAVTTAPSATSSIGGEEVVENPLKHAAEAAEGATSASASGANQPARPALDAAISGIIQKKKEGKRWKARGCQIHNDWLSWSGPKEACCSSRSSLLGSNSCPVQRVLCSFSSGGIRSSRSN